MSSTPTPRAQAAPSPWRVYFAVWGQAWLLTALGGGACGLVAVGYLTAEVGIWSVPVGLVLGACLGLPLGLGIAIAMTSWATPPRRPVVFAQRLDALGMGVALLITLPLNFSWSVGLLASAIDGVEPLRVIVHSSILIANCLLGAVAAAAVGRECGHQLAARHLRRFGLATPPRRSLRHPCTRSGICERTRPHTDPDSGSRERGHPRSASRAALLS